MRKMEHVTDLMERTPNIKIIKTDKNYLRIQIIKGSNKVVKIPLTLSKELAYLTAAIICDGHIRKDVYRVWLENVKKSVVENIITYIKIVFETNPSLTSRINKQGRTSYIISLKSKPITVLLNEVFGIPRGKKSHKVKVPELIRTSTPEIKKAFIVGVFDTDGGKRHRGLGLSSSSKQFRDDVVKILTELGFNVHKDEWVNKKYNKRYYGLYFNPRGSALVANGAGFWF